MALESGTYHIFNKLDNAPIGRNVIEDKSLLPKAVYKLPEGIQPPQWDVEKLPNRRYKLQNRGAAVGTVDGHLFAFLIEAETLVATLEWTIQRDAHDPHGNSYVIFKAGDGRGWVVADPSGEDVSKIAVRPLIVMPSEPPIYPRTDIFVFKKVE